MAKTLPFAVLIALVLVVLYRGIATPSESAAIGVLLVWVLVALIYRGLSGRQLLNVLLESTNQSTMILLITAFSAVIATVLSYLRVVRWCPGAGDRALLGLPGHHLLRPEDAVLAHHQAGLTTGWARFCVRSPHV